MSRPMPYRLNGPELAFAKAPFSYEFIAERPEGERWRICDRDGNAVGSAGTEAGAKTAIRRLQGGGAA